MRRYIGTKIVCAEPEEKNGRPGFKVVYDDGYKSWSPAEVFKRAYRELTDGEIDLIFTEGALADKS